MTEPVILQGYSYPFAQPQDVLDAEARRGRVVSVAIRHAGGWAVSSEERLGNCMCLEYEGDDEDCPVHGERKSRTLTEGESA